MTKINVIEFTEAVIKMRELQAKYFRTRSSFDLQAAKSAEKNVDDLLEIYKRRKKEQQDPQTKMEM